MKTGRSLNYYNKISSGYEELHKGEQEKKLKLIKEHIKPKKDWKLLDVGCGTGITSDFGCAVFGADPAIKLLEKSREKAKAKTKKKPDFIVCAEAEHLPFKNRSFDAVISVTALQNFHDVGKGLDEMKRTGKENCIFALSFLKRSGKRDFILKEIRKRFDVREEIEEEKDIILFCR